PSPTTAAADRRFDIDSDMTYQVLARKWRPKDFSSLVGQEPIVRALENALKEERIAQAYLFSGIRGVGKTTAARLLAKALNCTTPSAESGCCDACRDIDTGRSLDVVEVDAATYSKVEQVRELTESLRYGPADSRYKVAIIDEVHRLSRQAFDALLKIVEEPPPHLVFIFATTELDAVPATILSRCQQFQFRRVGATVLAEHLGHIAEAENITISDSALRMIARAGEGSVRDAVALLDQLATFGSGTIEDDDASRLLGGLDTAVFQRLLTAILEGDGATVAAVARDAELNGWEPRNVYSQFLGYVRDALHLTLGGTREHIELPQGEIEALTTLVGDRSHENLLRVLNLLLGAEAMVRRTEHGHLAAEIAWLRAAELPKVTRIEELLRTGFTAPPTGSPPPSNRGGDGPPTSRPGGREARIPAKTAQHDAKPTPPSRAPEPSPPPVASRPVASRPVASRSAASRPAPAPMRTDTTTNDTTTNDTGVTNDAPGDATPGDATPGDATRDGGTSGDEAQSVETVLAAVRSRSRRLAAMLVGHLDVTGGEILIHDDEGGLLGDAVQRPKNQALLNEVATEMLGGGGGWRLGGRRPTPNKPAPDKPAPRARTPRAAAERAPAPGPRATHQARTDADEDEHPLLRTVLDIFPGTIEGRRPTEETTSSGSASGGGASGGNGPDESATNKS
ncbi:MAG: DNA polymerase III subunit gamma/tau, partial [Acidobacteriota bacterium]